MSRPLANASLDQTRPIPNKSSPPKSPPTVNRQQALQAARSEPGLDLAAFDDWLSYRSAKRKPVSTGQLVAVAKLLASFGPQQAASVEHCKRSDYQGLHRAPPERGNASQHGRAGNGRLTQETALALIGAVQHEGGLSDSADPDNGLITAYSEDNQ